MNEQEEKYSLDSIIVRNWPELKNTKDNTWERIWQIKLREIPTETVNIQQIETNLSDDEKWVSINIDKKLVEIKVTTIEWGWEDYLYFYNYKILEYINDKIGEIDEIQGQRRDLWPPWQWKSGHKLAPLEYFIKRP